MTGTVGGIHVSGTVGGIYRNFRFFTIKDVNPIVQKELENGTASLMHLICISVSEHEDTRGIGLKHSALILAFFFFLHLKGVSFFCIFFFFLQAS